MKFDQLFNINFVKSVERNPCLYDFTNLDHARREKVDEAWDSIASEFEDTVSSCKERWKNLRTVFARNCRKRLSDPSRYRKQYYLDANLRFLLPFIKHKTDVVHTLSQPLASAPPDSVDICDETDDDDLSVTLPIPVMKRVEEQNETPRNVKKRKVKDSSDIIDNLILDYLESKRGEERMNSDKQFLLSLLPDLENMTAIQKRTFKVGVIQLIQHTFETSESSTHVDNSFSNV